MSDAHRQCCGEITTCQVINRRLSHLSIMIIYIDMYNVYNVYMQARQDETMYSKNGINLNRSD